MCHTMPNTQSTRVRIAVAITCKGCLMSIVVVISVWFWFFYLCGSESWGSWVSTELSATRLSDIFFMRLLVASVVFVSVAIKGVGISDCKDFRKILPVGVEIFAENRRLVLAIGLKSRKYLHHRNGNDLLMRIWEDTNGGKRMIVADLDDFSSWTKYRYGNYLRYWLDKFTSAHWLYYYLLLSVQYITIIKEHYCIFWLNID